MAEDYDCITSKFRDKWQKTKTVSHGKKNVPVKFRNKTAEREYHSSIQEQMEQN